MSVLREIYRLEGFNFGANLGAAIGAGVPGHARLHSVPCWSGDTNCMTTVDEVRVIPETLSETHLRVCEVLQIL